MDDQVSLIQDAILSGMGRKVICDKFGITIGRYDNIRLKMVRHGIDVPKTLSPEMKEARERISVMIAYALSGATVLEIAEATGENPQRVQRILRLERKRGSIPNTYVCALNYKGDYLSPEKIRERRVRVAKMAKQGYSATQITDELKIEDKVLRNDLRALKQARVLSFGFSISRTGIKDAKATVEHTEVIVDQAFPAGCERFEDDPRAVRECRNFDYTAAYRFGQSAYGKATDSRISYGVGTGMI